MSHLADLWGEVSRCQLGACLSPVRIGDGSLWTMKLGKIQIGPGAAEAVILAALAQLAQIGVENARENAAASRHVVPAVARNDDRVPDRRNAESSVQSAVVPRRNRENRRRISLVIPEQMSLFD